MPRLVDSSRNRKNGDALGAQEMRPPKQKFIQARRAKRAAPTPTASPALPLWRVAALEGVAEAEVPDPLVLALVADAGLEVVGVVAAVACVVVGVTGVVLVVVAPAPVVVPVPGRVALAEAVRQAVLEFACTVKAADWARVPVLSRRLRPREVPAVTLTVHVIEVPV